MMETVEYATEIHISSNYCKNIFLFQSLVSSEMGHPFIRRTISIIPVLTPFMLFNQQYLSIPIEVKSPIKPTKTK